MQLADFDYVLPAQLIARTPLAERDQSRLLHLASDGFRHARILDLPDLLRRQDLLVVNNTQVLNARLHAVKDTGGQVELLLERIESADTALFQARSSKPLRQGRLLRAAGETLRVLGRVQEFVRLRFPMPVADFLARHGETPLPPYLQRPPTAADSTRYQTLFARAPGAVAAPTAGLHFSEGLLQALADQGVELTEITLHTGAGTFAPVRENDISRHRMHSERFCVTADAAARIEACLAGPGRLIAVGTTVVRTLESLAESGGIRPGCDETRLFIKPGFRFRVVDAMLTNFHLPRSTLLMLVCAFAGRERVLAAYAAAVAARYRFFSYGDAMLVEPDPCSN